MIAHPRPDQIGLDAVLSALADPQRRAILDQIRDAGSVICSDVLPALPRSTVSVHLRRLREAGLIQQERRGQLIANQLRADAVPSRFPGLLDAIFPR